MPEYHPKNKGVHLSVWISDEQAAKLEAMTAASGLSRSKVIRRLLDGQTIPERSYTRTLSELARIGGLIKSHVTAGRQDEALALGREVLKIARSLQDAEICRRQ